MCDRCNGTGWREAIEGRDGSYITSRPCGCYEVMMQEYKLINSPAPVRLPREPKWLVK